VTKFIAIIVLNLVTL